MPRFKHPFLRPRLLMEYSMNFGPLTRSIIYYAYSKWQEELYPRVIAETPVTSSPDPRKVKGFVRSHIKLITTKGERGLKYRTIAVPGGTVKGSPAYHALSAVYAYHGRPGRPLTIHARPGSVLTFPLKKGERIHRPSVARPAPGARRGRKDWVVTRRVVQKKWAEPYPWISNIFERNMKRLVDILHRELIAARRKYKVKKIEIG